MADRAKFTLVPNATPFATHALHIGEPDYSGVWLNQFGIMLTGDIYCLAMNPASNCVLTILEDVSGDARGAYRS
ncbi:hypothetical protein TNCV_4081931 [Trichonephila clavipes]|nr:hypothetical protein TNCV_4081931 [Trichonephila clavipes]